MDPQRVEETPGGGVRDQVHQLRSWPVTSPISSKMDNLYGTPGGNLYPEGIVPITRMMVLNLRPSLYVQWGGKKGTKEARNHQICNHTCPITLIFLFSCSLLIHSLTLNF